MRRFLRRIAGRTCLECKGSGGARLSKIVNSDPLPCAECLGTGLRFVQQSEWAIRRRGEMKERRRKK